MLVRLLSTGQVVLLSDAIAVHLFYRGEVYFRPATSDRFLDLPAFKRNQYYPIWGLINSDLDWQGPPLSEHCNVWPVQATSPIPVRFSAWRKQQAPTMLGMPLWDIKELIEAYVFSWLSPSGIDPSHVL